VPDKKKGPGKRNGLIAGKDMMNDPQVPDRQHSESPVPDAFAADSIVAEQKSLDEAWAGFGQLLTAAKEPFDERGLVDAVCLRLANRHAQQQVRQRRLVLALAASLLAIVGGTWIGMPRNETPVAAAKKTGTGTEANGGAEDDGRLKQKTDDGMSGDSSLSPNDAASTADSSDAVSSDAAPSDAPVWNDDWESELAQTQEEVLATKEYWRQPVDWLGTVRERMDELEAEFGEGTL
jgi:hypothetical protein